MELFLTGDFARCFQQTILGYHLIVVAWGFACPNDPRSSVVWGFMPLVVPSMVNRSLGSDQKKHSPKDLLSRKPKMVPFPPCPDVDYWNPLLEPGLGAGHDSLRLVVEQDPRLQKLALGTLNDTSNISKKEGARAGA